MGIWQKLPSPRARGKRYDDRTLVSKMQPGSPSSLEAGCVASTTEPFGPACCFQPRLAACGSQRIPFSRHCGRGFHFRKAT